MLGYLRSYPWLAIVKISVKILKWFDCELTLKNCLFLFQYKCVSIRFSETWKYYGSFLLDDFDWMIFTDVLGQF